MHWEVRDKISLSRPHIQVHFGGWRGSLKKKRKKLRTTMPLSEGQTKPEMVEVPTLWGRRLGYGEPSEGRDKF